MRRGLLQGAFIVAACGGRISGSDGSAAALDASALPDATADAAAPDAPLDAEAGDGCSTPAAQVLLGSDNLQCKFTITWTCGATSYQVASGKGSGCDPTSDASRGFRGACTQNGSPIGAFDNADPGGCSCSEPAKLATLAAKACGFPM